MQVQQGCLKGILPCDPKDAEVQVTYTQFHKALKKVNPWKTVGRDGSSPRVLRPSVPLLYLPPSLLPSRPINRKVLLICIYVYIRLKYTKKESFSSPVLHLCWCPSGGWSLTGPMGCPLLSSHHKGDVACHKKSCPSGLQVYWCPSGDGKIQNRLFYLK